MDRGPWGLRRQYRDIKLPRLTFAERALDVIVGLVFFGAYYSMIMLLWPIAKAVALVGSQRGPLLLVVLAAGFGAWLAWMRGHWNFPIDFQLYWLAARHPHLPYDPSLMHAGEAHAMFPRAPLWQVNLPYYYPPPTMLFLWPLGLLPVQVAYCLFSGVTAALAMYLSVRRVRWLAVMLFLSAPLFYGAFIGQIGLLIGCVAILAFELIDQEPEISGLLLGVMICIKPQSAFIAPFVLWGRWSAARALIETGAFLCLASLIFGPMRWIEWLESVRGFSFEVQPIVPKIMPYLLFGWGEWWRVLLIGIGLAFAAWDRRLPGFLVGTLLCTPYFQLYDLVGFSYLGLLIFSQWKRLGPLKGLGPSAFGLALIVCPAWSETMTLFSGGIILGTLALRRAELTALFSSQFDGIATWRRSGIRETT